MNPFWMVVADLRRSLLSSLGILVLLALAFSATVTISLLERSLRSAGAATARDFDLVVGAPGSRLDLVLTSVFLRTDEVLPLLDFTQVEALAADPRVEALSPLVFADHYRNAPVVGVGPDFPRLRPSLTLASGRWPVADFEVVAGGATGSSLGEEFEGSHGVADREGVEEEHHHEAAYHVVGTLAPTGTPWDEAFLTPYEGIWHLHGDHERAVSAVLVKPKDFASAYALRAAYREGPTTAAFPGEVLSSLFGMFEDAKRALSLVTLVFQTLVFAAVLLSLLASLPAQARWLGLLRALGAGPGYLFVTLWAQSALVLALAALVGAGVGWAGALGLASVVESRTGLALAVEWTWGETGILGLYGIAGVVGALVPALAGYRTSVRLSLQGR